MQATKAEIEKGQRTYILYKRPLLRHPRKRKNFRGYFILETRRQFYSGLMVMQLSVTRSQVLFRILAVEVVYHPLYRVAQFPR